MKNLPTDVAKVKQQQEFRIKSKFGEEKPYECPFCANDLLQNNQELINQDVSLPEEKVQQLLLPRFIETNINFKTHVTIPPDEEKCPDLFQNIDEAKNDISPTQKIHVPTVNEPYTDEARSSQKFKKIKVRRLVLKPFKSIIRTSSEISKNDVTKLENSQNTSKIPVDIVHVVMADQRVRDNLGKRVEEHSCKNCGLIFSENKDLSWHYTQDHKLPAIMLLKLPISVGDIVVTE
ncbi:unnamed protein product [Allacma fusca]|uniref:C2H2-type domain-containing protein n=1 Tax=Allacma fusca TaxID=39272 RepID=A0A8J2PUY7_9HEXA|nr:unnamed protein product [Allacma fusca]